MGQRANFRRSVTAHESFSGDLLHTGVIISTRSTSEWPVTSVFRLAKVGNKEKTVVFVGKISYTVAIMPRL